jgi:REP element-mobilizing transposase RayT
MEAWLDRVPETAYLQEPAIAEMVMESITFRQQRDWNMFEFVVMPTHLHLFFEILRGGLKSVMEQFKRWTGHQAAKLMDLDGDRFWQDEWFDHWSRSDDEDEKIMHYIRRNPEKAKPGSSYLDWPYGSWQAGSLREPNGSRSGEPSRTEA